MDEMEARRLGRQTASEDFATRGGGPPPPTRDLWELAYEMAVREMLRSNGDVQTAKRWGIAFLASYNATYDELFSYAVSLN